MLMNAGLESIDMWAIGTNERGLSITEWVLHSYKRASDTDPSILQQHGVAGIHKEECIPSLRVPTKQEPAAGTLAESKSPSASQ